MMQLIFGIMAGAMLLGTAAFSQTVVLQSAHDVETTIDRLEAAVEDAGGTVFARVDHAQGAASVDMELGPSTVLIFGNPRLGTPAMQLSGQFGLDLPLKALAWEDEDGTVRLARPDPVFLAGVHGVDPAAEVISRMEEALANLTGRAVAQ